MPRVSLTPLAKGHVWALTAGAGAQRTAGTWEQGRGTPAALTPSLHDAPLKQRLTYPSVTSGEAEVQVAQEHGQGHTGSVPACGDETAAGYPQPRARVGGWDPLLTPTAPEPGQSLWGGGGASGILPVRKTC